MAKLKRNPIVICLHCGWVHFQVSRKHAVAEVKTFNAWYDGQSKETQALYGSKSSLRSYERCMLCGTCYHNFRRATKAEIPVGSTINPIIDKRD